MFRVLTLIIILAGFTVQPVLAGAGDPTDTGQRFNRKNKKTLLGMFTSHTRTTSKPKRLTKPARKRVARPARKRVAKPKITRKSRKTARNKKTRLIKWWKITGNPAVFAFRDCASAYATNQFRQGSTLPHGQIITSAMNGVCQKQFVHMAAIMLKGLGQSKSDETIRELAKTTFLPAISQAASNINAQIAVKASPQQNLALSKTRMLNCFINKADSLSASKIADTEHIANTTLAYCQDDSDRFFAGLFARYPGNRQLQQARKNQALNLTYKTAIMKRINILRGNQTAKTASRP